VFRMVTRKGRSEEANAYSIIALTYTGGETKLVGFTVNLA
jgi:hypothetical protein